MKFSLRRLIFGLILTSCLFAFAWRIQASALRLTSPGAVLVEQGSETEANHELILKIINFLLLTGALAYFLRKPFKEFFAQRSASIRQRLDEGRQALEAAQAKMAEVEARLASLKAEVEQLKTVAQKEMEAEHRRLRQETSEEVVKIQHFAQAQIVASARVAMTELKNYVALEAVGLAREIIKNRLDEKSQRKLVSFFVADLPSSKANRN